MSRECGCERGDDCTKTTVCAIDAALQDQADEVISLTEHIAELHEECKGLYSRIDELKTPTGARQ